MSIKTSYVLLATDFKPVTGGIAEYLHNLWNEVARSVPVTVMSTVQKEGKVWEHTYRYEQLPPVPSRCLGERAGDSFPIARKINTALYFHHVKRYAKDVVDIVTHFAASRTEVFIGSWWGELSHYLCVALRARKIPYSIHVYGLELVSPFYGRFPAWRYEDLKYAKGVYACSRGSAALVSNRVGLDRVVVAVPPGIRSENRQMGTDSRKWELSKSINIEGKLVLLTVGRLIPRKGIELVLKSVAELSSEFHDLCYIVAGEGPDRKRLKHLTQDLGISERVFFLGEVDEITKTALYELCDIFVMPNRLLEGLDWEGFGIVFLEAALAGKPSIGGNNGGVADAIEHEMTGLLVNTDKDARDTTAAIRRLLSDETLRIQLGKAAYERAVNHFSWDSVGNNFLKMLGEI